jgi:hypothetical protein
MDPVDDVRVCLSLPYIEDKNIEGIGGSILQFDRDHEMDNLFYFMHNAQPWNIHRVIPNVHCLAFNALFP